MDEYQGDEPEEYEQIPWSHLVPVQKDRSLQLAVLVAVVVAALLAIVLIIRRAAAPEPLVAVPATTVVPAPAAGPLVPGQPGSSQPSSSEPSPFLPSPAPTDVTMTPAGVPQPQIYSEADLMAVLPPRPELEAIARAEWFVTDYFTVDGDGSLADGVAAALPDAVDLPVSDGSAISYVEWARAVAVADNLDGSYEVTVWFRTLAGDADAGFARTAVRAVDVHLVADDTGRLAIADVPVVVELASLGMAPAWPATAVAPPEVVATSAQQAAAFGAEPELETAGRVAGGWRLLFSVGDASGLRFPVVVRSQGE